MAVDYSYNKTVDPTCVDPNKPKVDNTSIECSEIISTNCVATSKGYPYLGVGKGETLTSVLEKIKDRFKSITFIVQNLGTGTGILKSFTSGVLTAKTIKAGNNVQLSEANDTITISSTSLDVTIQNLGTGTGILKNFTSGVLTAKTIKAGNNIQLSEANDTITVDVTGLGVVNITHAQLVVKKNSNQLTPGVFYRITDFATMYDQPDYDSAGLPKSTVAAKVGPVEPIIVLALTTNTLSSSAYQEAYPKDTIEYILEFTTPVNNTVTKGRIIYRKDDFGNETDFDHRNVLFKRYLHPIRTIYYISHKDTSLASAEYKFTTATVPQSTYKNKATGHFNRFRSSLGAIPFDLPNIVLNPQSTNIFRELTFDVDSNNLTLMEGVNSSFNVCSNSLFEVIVSESIIKDSLNSEVFKSPGNPVSDDSFGIHKANINGLVNCKIIVDKIYVAPYLSLGSVFSDNFYLVNSSVRLTTLDLAPISGIPARSYSFFMSEAWINEVEDSEIDMRYSNVNIEYCSSLQAEFFGSKLAELTNCTGIVNFTHSTIYALSNTNLLNTTFSNVNCPTINNVVLKQNQSIENVNVLAELSNLDLSSANIIYQSGSKEVIKPAGINTTLIKHYDQFGAAVINNINA